MITLHLTRVTRSLIVIAALLASACVIPPNAAPDVAPDSASPGGAPLTIGRTFELESEALGGPRQINVWLPPSYAQDSAESNVTYPVLYVLDGGADQDFYHISGLGQLGWISGTIADMIVVGVQSQDRAFEFTAAPHDPRYQFAPGERGGADQIGRAHV